MFGSNDYTIETPNVIDPGDLPPTTPLRSPDKVRDRVFSDSEEEKKLSDEEYEKARANRLLNDIDDLVLDDHEPYDPYDDEEQQQYHHSLPSSPEEVKMLRTEHWEEHQPLSTNARKRRQQHHNLRWSILKILQAACAILGLLVFGIVLGVLVAGKESSSTTSPPPPTSKQSLARREAIMEWLHQNSITSMADLVDAGSPQNRAVHWMATEDKVYRDLPESIQDDETRFLQRYVMATFYYAMSGEDWKVQPKFLTNQDECGWSILGIGADYMQNAFTMGIACNEDLKVTSLMLPQNDLTGSLPSEMKHLRSLTILSLPFNAIWGEIPDLSSMTELIFFDLKYNMLEGSLPSFLGDIGTLEVLSVSNNDLSGILPPNYAKLARLHTLGIDDNNFTGPIDFVNELKSLEFFYADRNSLTGTIDEDFLKDLTDLFELDLSSNQFTSSSIPSSLFMPRKLRILDLSDNMLSGSLPQLLPINENLVFLSLRYNQVSGSLGVDSVHNLRNLRHLDLYDNQLSGILPPTMQTMSSLEYLALGYNNFSQRPVPNFLYSLTKLRELSLQSAQLTGFIPDFMGSLTDLVLLDLSQNELEGNIPSSVFQLPKLEFLLLNDNLLEGGLPSSVGNPDLKFVSLHKNLLNGNFDPFCQAAPDMDLFAVDCADTQCSNYCCPQCCQPDETDCFLDSMNSYLTSFEGLWEYNYNRAIYGTDIQVLDEYPKDSVSPAP